MSETFRLTRRIDPHLHAGLTGAEPVGHLLEPCAKVGIGNGVLDVFVFAVKELKVICGKDVIVAVFAAPGFEHAQNSFDARRRF